jgi:RNA polymerase sigma-70 factor (ECF subfamily)
MDADELYRRHGGYIRALCRRVVADVDRVEDLSQEIWEEILRSLPGFRNESKITTWMFTIARRVLLRQSQRERHRSLSEFAWTMERQVPERQAPDGMAVDDWVRHHCRRCLAGMVHCLAPEKRLVYILREIMKLPHGEIAAITGRKEAAVRQIHARAARRIKRFLEGNYPLFATGSDCSCGMKRLLPDSAVQAEVVATGRLVEDFVARLSAEAS